MQEVNIKSRVTVLRRYHELNLVEIEVILEWNYLRQYRETIALNILFIFFPTSEKI